MLLYVSYSLLESKDLQLYFCNRKAYFVSMISSNEMQEYGNGRRGIGQWNKFKFRLRGIHISHLSYIYVNLQLLIDHFMQRMTADKDVQIYASKVICIIIMLSIFLSNFTGGDHLLNNRKNCWDMAVVT